MAKRRKAPTMDAKFRIPVDEKSRKLCGRGPAYLEAVANRLLAKSGFFAEAEQPLGEFQGKPYYRTDTEADAIGSHGLRPTWFGRA